MTKNVEISKKVENRWFSAFTSFVDSQKIMVHRRTNSFSVFDYLNLDASLFNFELTKFRES